MEVQNNQLYRCHPTMFQDQVAMLNSHFTDFIRYFAINCLQVFFYVLLVKITNFTRLFTTYLSNLLFIMKNNSLTHRSLIFIFQYISILKLSSILFSFLFLYQNLVSTLLKVATSSRLNQSNSPNPM